MGLKGEGVRRKVAIDTKRGGKYSRSGGMYTATMGGGATPGQEVSFKFDGSLIPGTQHWVVRKGKSWEYDGPVE